MKLISSIAGSIWIEHAVFVHLNEWQADAMKYLRHALSS
jgi:hypothetical protein